MRRFRPISIRHHVPHGVATINYHPPAIEEARPYFEAHLEQVLAPTPPGFEPYYQHLACCQVWTGPVSGSGQGRIDVCRRWMVIQEYARILHRVEPWGDYKLFSTGVPSQRKVYRCIAAGTKNCVHKQHMGWVTERTRHIPPTTLQVRDSIRYHFSVGPNDHADRWPPSVIAQRFHLSEARVCRILLYLEGPDDPRMFEQLRVSTSAR
jgi:hypothetical protein